MKNTRQTRSLEGLKVEELVSQKTHRKKLEAIWSYGVSVLRFIQYVLATFIEKNTSRLSWITSRYNQIPGELDWDSPMFFFLNISLTPAACILKHVSQVSNSLRWTYSLDLHAHLGGGSKYFLFSPRTRGKWSNLTSIFFNWVAQLPTSHGFWPKRNYTKGIRQHWNIASFFKWQEWMLMADRLHMRRV